MKNPIHKFFRPFYSQSNENLCLLIDFENVALGVRDTYPGQPLDLTPIVQFVRSIGTSGGLTIARAYADWRLYPEITEHLVSLGIQSIHSPAYRLQGKNSTDIRMAVDAVHILHEHPDIGTYVIVSGDSDFNSLVLSLREYGKKIIGIGVEGSVSLHFEKSCDRFERFGHLSGWDSPEYMEPRKRESSSQEGTRVVREKPAVRYNGQPDEDEDRVRVKESTPLAKNLRQLKLEPENIIPARRLKTLLPKVHEMLRASEGIGYRELREALPKKHPDAINRGEATQISNLLDRLGVLRNAQFTMNWMEKTAPDGEKMFDVFLAVFESKLRETTGGQAVDTEALARLLFDDSVSRNEVNVRLMRGRKLLESR